MSTDWVEDTGTPPDEPLPASTRLDRDNAVRAQSMAASQLPAVRRQAAAWRNGLASLTTLTAIFGIATGLDGVHDLTPDRRLALGVSLAVSFLALLCGSLFAMRAAFGWPADAKLLTAQAISEHDRREVPRTTCYVRIARVLFVAGVALIAVAGAAIFTNPAPVGKTWVKVTTSDRHSYCGVLTGMTRSRLVLTSTTELGQHEVRNLSLSAVLQLHVVPSC